MQLQQPQQPSQFGIAHGVASGSSHCHHSRQTRAIALLSRHLAASAGTASSATLTAAAPVSADKQTGRPDIRLPSGKTRSEVPVRARGGGGGGGGGASAAGGAQRPQVLCD